MIGGIIILILTGLLSYVIIGRLHKTYPFINPKLLKNLFAYHILLSLAYYGYVLFNPSDSKYYYEKVVVNFRGDSWFDFYGTSTTFIEFIGYPFVKFFGLSYEGVMAVFAFIGFLGFVYFYIFFRENIRFKHTFFGYDLFTLILFLPNLHFWSASFGKGAVIFFGLGLFFFGISNIRKRLAAIIIGGIIIYHVRPHIMMVVLVCSAIGFVFSTRGISIAWRVFFLIGASVAFFFIYQDVLALVGIDEEEFVSEGLDLSHRVQELTKADSGVDIASYNLPMKLFTFLYRPLFFDSPGIFGLIVSVENLFYILISLKLLASIKGVKFLFTGSFLTKSAFLTFLAVSIALAQVSGNLGLAIRQKSQVMILFMFVIISFLDEQKFVKWKMLQRRKAQQLRRKQAVGSLNGV